MFSLYKYVPAITCVIVAGVICICSFHVIHKITDWPTNDKIKKPLRGTEMAYTIACLEKS